MGNGNSKLLLGLGLGAIVGGVLGYLANSSKGRKMRKDMCCAAHEIEKDAYSILSTAKEKVEEARCKILNKTARKVDEAKEKMNEVIND